MHCAGLSSGALAPVKGMQGQTMPIVDARQLDAKAAAAGLAAMQARGTPAWRLLRTAILQLPSHDAGPADCGIVKLPTDHRLSACSVTRRAVQAVESLLYELAQLLGQLLRPLLSQAQMEEPRQPLALTVLLKAVTQDPSQLAQSQQHPVLMVSLCAASSYNCPAAWALKTACIFHMHGALMCFAYVTWHQSMRVHAGCVLVTSHCHRAGVPLGDRLLGNRHSHVSSRGARFLSICNWLIFSTHAACRHHVLLSFLLQSLCLTSATDHRASGWTPSSRWQQWWRTSLPQCASQT